ncbi:MAG: methionine gamma-lyase [Alphaproteobacteria bacterium]|nr:MAG: methionine gamma-lyase [Alphaproteobacteria bacterium]
MTYKKKTIGEHKLTPETLMMSYGYDPKLSEGSVKPPVFLTSTFVFSSAEEGEEFFNVMSGRKEGNTGGLIYSRFNHPNAEIIEDRMALLEGSESAAVLSSGMGAISAVLFGFLRPGDVILHSAPLYGGTETLIRGALAEFGIKSVSFADGLDEKALKSAVEKAKSMGRLAMIFFETPANPTNTLVDFKLLLNIIDEVEKDTGHRPISVCDNTMLGPIYQRACPQGIDLATYSLTKYIGGHSDLVAGAVCGNKGLLRKIKAMRGSMGLNLDPHTSWMISRSLETLSIRMTRAAETGYKVAEWLANNPYQKADIYHPDFITDERYQKVYKRQCTGPGSTFSFVMDVPKEKSFKLINSLSLFKSAVSLGGTESLVCHPASTTHSGIAKELRELANVNDGLIRLSIGLEHPDDLIADLENAFRATFS